MTTTPPSLTESMRLTHLFEPDHTFQIYKDETSSKLYLVHKKTGDIAAVSAGAGRAVQPNRRFFEKHGLAQVPRYVNTTVTTCGDHLHRILKESADRFMYQKMYGKNYIIHAETGDIAGHIYGKHTPLFYPNEKFYRKHGLLSSMKPSGIGQALYILDDHFEQLKEAYEPDMLEHDHKEKFTLFYDKTLDPSDPKFFVAVHNKTGDVAFTSSDLIRPLTIPLTINEKFYKKHGLTPSGSSLIGHELSHIAPQLKEAYVPMNDIDHHKTEMWVDYDLLHRDERDPMARILIHKKTGDIIGKEADHSSTFFIPNRKFYEKHGIEPPVLQRYAAVEKARLERVLKEAHELKGMDEEPVRWARDYNLPADHPNHWLLIHSASGDILGSCDNERYKYIPRVGVYEKHGLTLPPKTKTGLNVPHLAGDEQYRLALHFGNRSKGLDEGYELAPEADSTDKDPTRWARDRSLAADDSNHWILLHPSGDILGSCDNVPGRLKFVPRPAAYAKHGIPLEGQEDTLSREHNRILSYITKKQKISESYTIIVGQERDPLRWAKDDKLPADHPNHWILIHPSGDILGGCTDDWDMKYTPRPAAYAKHGIPLEGMRESVSQEHGRIINHMKLKGMWQSGSQEHKVNESYKPIALRSVAGEKFTIFADHSKDEKDSNYHMVVHNKSGDLVGKEAMTSTKQFEPNMKFFEKHNITPKPYENYWDLINRIHKIVESYEQVDYVNDNDKVAVFMSRTLPRNDPKKYVLVHHKSGDVVATSSAVIEGFRRNDKFYKKHNIPMDRSDGYIGAELRLLDNHLEESNLSYEMSGISKHTDAVLMFRDANLPSNHPSHWLLIHSGSGDILGRSKDESQAFVPSKEVYAKHGIPLPSDVLPHLGTEAGRLRRLLGG